MIGLCTSDQNKIQEALPQVFLLFISNVLRSAEATELVSGFG